MISRGRDTEGRGRRSPVLDWTPAAKTVNRGLLSAEGRGLRSPVLRGGMYVAQGEPKAKPWVGGVRTKPSPARQDDMGSPIEASRHLIFLGTNHKDALKPGT